MKNTIVSVSILATGLAFSGVAHAAVVASSTLNVSATVAVDCTVTTTPVNFGNLNAAQFSFSAASNGDISVTCSPGVLYNITLDSGSTLVGIPNAFRQMTSLNDGVSRARYFLASDIGLANQWGDAGYANTYPSGSSVSDTGNGVVQSHTVYGGATGADIFGTASPSGAYSDTVTVTVNY
ncbi:MAG: spore coat protein U domain-containing protein [Gallionella sp.]|nr:spore coat protein U domain-containing protein [Gallionella sp.]